MAAPYFRCTFKGQKLTENDCSIWGYEPGTLYHCTVHIRTGDLELLFSRPPARMSFGQWFYVGTKIDGIFAPRHSALKLPLDGEWNEILECAYHDNSIGGKL